MANLNCDRFLSFDGINGSVSLADSQSLRITNYTVEVWIKPYGALNEEWKGILGKPGRNFNILLNSAGYIAHRFQTTATTNGAAPDTPPASIQWNVWNHVAITNDGTTAKTYINGELKAEGPTGGNLVVHNKTLYLGCNLDNGEGNYFNGLMAEVRVWNQVRTQSEIEDNMRTCLTGSEDGLVAYLPLDEADEDKAYDKSSKGNHGTLNQGVTWNEPLKIGDKCDEFLSFDGINDSVSLADSQSLRITDYTAEVWIKPYGKPNEVWKGILGKPGRNFNIWLNNAGYIHHRFHTTASTNDGASNTPEASIQWNVWNHVAITNDGTTAKTYINGELKAEDRTGGNLVVDNTALYLGCNLDNGKGNYFNGLMAEVRVWNKVRTQSEIEDNMHKCLTGSEDGLVAYLPCVEEADGEKAYDKTSNGNHGTLNQGITWNEMLSIKPAVPKTFLIKSKLNGLALVGNPYYDAKTGAVDSNSPNQRWTISPDGVIKNQTGFVLDYQDAGMAPYYVVMVNPMQGANGSASQQWIVEDGLIKNKQNQNLVLDIAGASSAPGATILAAPLIGGPNQTWELVEV